MSTLLTYLARLLAHLRQTDRADAGPDSMSLRDWADLPVHHPLSDRTPC